MKRTSLALCLAAAVAAQAQTAHKPASTTAKSGTTAAKSTTATHAGAATRFKLPPGVPAVPGPVKAAFTLRYQDIKIGTGPEAEPLKVYKVLYTGYRAADGVKFDSSDMHRQPITDKDGKPEMGPDGKPKLGDPQPLVFPQGMGRLIPGFDEGVLGMHIGGKRRLFIPWQLAYGTREIPDRGPDHPGIPAKSDLIFDVELVDVADLPAPPSRPGAGAPGQPHAPGTPGAPPQPHAPGTPGTTPPPSTPPPAESQPK